MKGIYNEFTELIGNTPMLHMRNLENDNDLKATVLAKLELFNPAGSIKDRVAKAMIEDAEKRSLIRKGGVIVEPTSGNTGIGLAAVATSKGYRVILTMPETMSIERRNLLKAYGAEVVLTEGELGMSGAIEKAKELAEKIQGSYMPGQFENQINAMAHYETTGPEIWRDTHGKIDILVACVGTGGTLTGTGRYLKEQNPEIKVIAVEPSASPVLSQGRAGTHRIQGIGAGFVPEVLDVDVYDEVIAVDDDAAYAMSREIALTEGVFTGISSGAATYAASEVARRRENHGKVIVVILPDTGERYISTPGLI